MDFEKAFSEVKKIMPFLDINTYDAFIVKQLKASNTLDNDRMTHQTHIAITVEQMDIFPCLYPFGYFSVDYENKKEDLKKFFILRLPFYLYNDNLSYLDESSVNSLNFSNKKQKTFVSCIRSRREEGADQIQLALKTYDDEKFANFRKLLKEKDYLFVLKYKEKIEYDCFGIKQADTEILSNFKKDFNNKFFYKKTETLFNLTPEICDDVVDKEQFKPSQIIYYGVPGSGKSHLIDKETEGISEEQKMRIVFHPEYTNADFIGQILPCINGEEVEYKFKAGPFTRILKRALNNPEKAHYLIIEEINRGNAAAIFGDLFQLLDRDSSGWSSYSVENLDINTFIRSEGEGDSDKDSSEPKKTGEEEFKGIKLPPNLSLLATMNTSDQNVFTLDNAFQRRWEMKLVENKFDTDTASENQRTAEIDGIEGITWGEFQTEINKKISITRSELSSMEDKRLGCWFVKAKDKKIGKNQFAEKVLKYLWDDAFKFSHDEIFDEKYKSLEDLVNDFKVLGNDGINIFKEDFQNILKDTSNPTEEKSKNDAE